VVLTDAVTVPVIGAVAAGRLTFLAAVPPATYAHSPGLAVAVGEVLADADPLGLAAALVFLLSWVSITIVVITIAKTTSVPITVVSSVI
jgi:hypothetical protein